MDAGARTAAFALAAVVARPIGGALSDRIPPKFVVLASLGGTAVMAAIAVLQPPPDLWSAVTFTLLLLVMNKDRSPATIPELDCGPSTFDT